MAVVEDIVVGSNVMKVFDIEFPIAISLILFISEIPMIETTVKTAMMEPEVMEVHAFQQNHLPCALSSGLSSFR